MLPGKQRHSLEEVLFSSDENPSPHSVSLSPPVQKESLGQGSQSLPPLPGFEEGVSLSRKYEPNALQRGNRARYKGTQRCGV